jgi:anthranilate 1,2-dioxygenase small subunit
LDRVQTDYGILIVIDADMRQRLDDLQTDYVHAIDDDKLEDWPEYFIDDSRYKIMTRETYEAVYCNSKGMMSDRVMALRTANIYEPHTYCHLLSRARYESKADGTITGRTNFSVTRTMQDGQMDLFAVGKYLDTFVEQDGELKFSERLVIIESRRIDVLLVFPI